MCMTAFTIILFQLFWFSRHYFICAVFNMISNIPLKGFVTQFSMVLIICLGSFLTGCSIGWGSPALQQLRSPNSSMKLTSDDEAKLAIYHEIGHFITPIIAGYTADKLGRKPVFVICAFFALAGWCIKYLTSSFTMLILARFLLGVYFGTQFTIMSIYSAEITSKNVRGSFGSLMFVSSELGILFQFIIGNVFPLHTMSLVSAIVCVVYLTLLLFLLESPYYLAPKHHSEAKRNLCLLRGASEDEVAEELYAILNRTSTKVDLTKPALKSLALCLVLSFLCDLTGGMAIIAYATQSLSSDGHFSASSFAILLATLNSVFPLISTFLTDRIGRKIIILVTAGIGAVMHLLSGVLCFLNNEMKMEIPFYGWLLFATITGFLCCYSMFLINILLARGELISENNRGLGSGLVSTVFALAILVAIKSFQIVRDHWGLHCSFWMLSVVGFGLVFVTSIFFPETKGKTFDEIQRHFGRK